MKLQYILVAALSISSLVWLPARAAEVPPHRLLRQLQEPGPLIVGDELETRIANTGESAVAPVVGEDGTKQNFKIKLREGASYVALHFSSFNLAPGCVMKVSGKERNVLGKKQEYEMTGQGKMQMGEFWAQHVAGDEMFVQVKCQGKKVKDDGKFVVDKVAVGFGPEHGPSIRARRAAICGTDDKENAICYSGTSPTEYDKSKAVARLLINGSTGCTGWLASAGNHLVTNEHCINSVNDAANTDYEFMADAPDCESDSCWGCHPGEVFSGATFIQGNSNLDYALVQIAIGDPAGTYGFLQIDDRSAEIGEQIYIPQHPGRRAKQLGIVSSHSSDSGGTCQVNSFEPACLGSGHLDVGYFCDTEGGSSGSPVLATSSHKVIALHHCANCENRGVPINLVCNEICSLLGSGPECTINSDCDDGNLCTFDNCNDEQTCVHTSQPDCCGNGDCEASAPVPEDCNSCPEDCISGSGNVCGNDICEPGEDCLNCEADCNGRQSGKPSKRYCCSGDEQLGGGTNPVDCTDSRCWVEASCVNTPASQFCCGDAVCEGGEDNENCHTDCGCYSDTECDDYVACTQDNCVEGACINTPNDTSCPDNGLFCDGDEYCDAVLDCWHTGTPCASGQTCDDFADECVVGGCLPAGDSCVSGSECCSGQCHWKKGWCKG